MSNCYVCYEVITELQWRPFHNRERIQVWRFAIKHIRSLFQSWWVSAVSQSITQYLLQVTVRASWLKNQYNTAWGTWLKATRPFPLTVDGLRSLSKTQVSGKQGFVIYFQRDFRNRLLVISFQLSAHVQWGILSRTTEKTVSILLIMWVSWYLTIISTVMGRVPKRL